MPLVHQIAQLPSVGKMMPEHTLMFEDHGDQWEFITLKPKPQYEAALEFQRQEVVRKNNHTVARFVLNQGPYMEACRVKLNPGYPVIAVRAAFGLGSKWDTMLFGIWKGQLRKMGRPPATNSRGPVLWNSRDDVWEFDNFDRDPGGFRKKPGYVLMRVDRQWHLQVFRFISDRHPKVPTTIITPDLR